MKNVLVITDPGLDPDDLLTAWLLCRLKELGSINIVGMVANYDPAIPRAMLLKGALKSLGHKDIPVGYGTKCNAKHEPRDYEFYPESFELASFAEIMQGYKLMRTVLERAEPRSITLLLISGLTDVYQLLSSSPLNLIEKIKEVYIMGGASYQDGDLVADPTASNNKFDSGLNPQRVYDTITAYGIPLRVLSRHTAYACGINPKFYESLQYLNPVASHLYEIQRAAINSLWQFANGNPPEHRQNRQWFCRTFCEMDDIPVSADDEPWQYVRKLAIYDPLTVMWMVYPELFDPMECPIYDINGGPDSSKLTCEIVGLSAERPGIKDKTLILKKMMDVLEA